MASIKNAFKKQGVAITDEKEQEIAGELAQAGIIAIQVTDLVNKLSRSDGKVAVYTHAMNLVTAMMSAAPVAPHTNPTDPDDCKLLCDTVIDIVISVMVEAGSFKTAAHARKAEIADAMKWA